MAELREIDCLAGPLTAGTGGGGGGSDDYEELSNKPQINGYTLKGNKTSDQLGIKDSVIYDASSETTVDGYSVPVIPNTLLTKIYNSIMSSGNPVYVESSSSNDRYLFVNAKTDGSNIYTYFVYGKDIIVEYKSSTGTNSDVSITKLGVGQVIDVGSNQYIYDTYSLPAIDKEYLVQIYNNHKAPKLQVIKWTLLGSETYLKCVSADYIAGNYSIDVLVHNKYHCQYTWNASTSGLVNPEVKQENKENAYEYLQPVGDIDDTFLAYASYTELDYATAEKSYDMANFNIPKSCSSIVKDGKLIRSYDWLYSNACEFVVRTPAINNRHSVLGVVGQITGLEKDFVKSGEYSPLYKIMPFALVDGKNDSGLKANINVVPNDNGNTTGTLSGGKKLNALMFIRYILDNYSSVDEVITATENDLDIFVPQELRDMGYEVHFMVSDNDMTCILEFKNNACVWTEHNKMTNFFIDDVTFKTDGTVPVIGDADIDDYGLTDRSAGLERYNIIVNHTGTDKALLEKLKYTQLYTLSSNKWYSELCGVNSLKITSPISAFEPVMTTARQQYATRSRNNPVTDQSVHAVIYDNDKLTIYTQENYTDGFTFKLTKKETAVASWGSIIGDITNQTDLINKLNSQESEYAQAGYTFNIVTDDSTGLRKHIFTVQDKNGNYILNKEVSQDIENIAEALADVPMTFTNKTLDCGSFN